MAFLRPLPPGVGLWHPGTLLATWFGIGLIRIASGTWGSLAALPVAYLLVWAGGPVALLAATILVFVVGIWASNHVGRSGEKDSSSIVIDEVAAQWLTLMPLAVTPLALDIVYYLLGFVLFRIADVAKPWPVSWADRRVAAGLGVMLDDVFAALYAGGVLWVVLAVLA
ncbi:MAG: phosphatidylglycerophosphatase A family protein [Inquilinaceae bacterium]